MPFTIQHDKTNAIFEKSYGCVDVPRDKVYVAILVVSQYCHYSVILK